MFTKDHIEKILRINGLSTSASDEDIKSVLLYANCQNVDAAISALRDTTIDGKKDLCGLKKTGAKCNILLADQRLKPENIKELLGIDVSYNYADIDSARASRKSISFAQIFGIFLWSLFGAIATILVVMWYFQSGIFHLY